MKMIARILPLLLVALPVAAQSMPSSLTDSWKALSFLQGTWEAKATGGQGVSAKEKAHDRQAVGWKSRVGSVLIGQT